MAEDQIPELAGWVTVPQVQQEFELGSDSAARKLVRTSGLFRIDPDPRKSEIVKVKIGGNWVYLVKKSALPRVKRARAQSGATMAAAKQKNKHLAAGRSFRIQVRAWLRARDVKVRMDRPIPDEHYQLYLDAHPDATPPPGYKDLPPPRVR